MSLFGALLIALSLGGSAEARTVHPQKSPAGKPPLEVFIPAGWQMEAPWTVEYSYSAKANLLGPGKDTQARCHITFREDTSAGFQQTDYQSKILSQMEVTRSQFRILRRTPFPIQGNAASRVTASWLDGGGLSKGVFYFLSKNQRKVVLECIAPADDHERFISSFDQIAQRLTVH